MRIQMKFPKKVVPILIFGINKKLLTVSLHKPLKTTDYLPTTLVLYNTIDSDVGLAYLTTATAAMGDMIMSLVPFTKI